MKVYLNHSTTEMIHNDAAQAMSWHRAGDKVEVLTYDDMGKMLSAVMLEGEPQETQQEKTDRENQEHCMWISRRLADYVDGNVRRCPECGEGIRRDWNDVGEFFKCPECGHVVETDTMEILSVWDYLGDDIYNVEFRVSQQKEINSVQIMVACGGPNIYLDTATKNVELYWWYNRASYPLSFDTVVALDDWAEEYWGCL